MKVESTELPGVLRISPRIHRDERGAFLETWSARRYREAGLPELVQDNLALSRRGVLRGLHYQWPHAQGKLVTVVSGRIFDVAVDIRVGSPTFGWWAGYTLSDDANEQLYIPPGFAHGYLALSELAVVVYKCSDYYEPGAEGVVAWNDPALAIAWPVDAVELSEKDRRGMPLGAIPLDRLPRYGA